MGRRMDIDPCTLRGATSVEPGSCDVGGVPTEGLAWSPIAYRIRLSLDLVRTSRIKSKDRKSDSKSAVCRTCWDAVWRWAESSRHKVCWTTAFTINQEDVRETYLFWLVVRDGLSRRMNLLQGESRPRLGLDLALQDNGSVEDTASLVSSMAATQGIVIMSIHTPQHGLPGISIATRQCQCPQQLQPYFSYAVWMEINSSDQSIQTRVQFQTQEKLHITIQRVQPPNHNPRPHA
jgi:hypothetical protein